MGKKPETTEVSVLRAQVRWLERELRDVGKDLDAARSANSHTAVAQLRNRRQAIRSQCDQARIRLIAIAPKIDLDESDLPPDEWRAKVEADARVASIDDLETYLAEWLRRRKLRLEVMDGLPVLRPLA